MPVSSLKRWRPCSISLRSALALVMRALSVWPITLTETIVASRPMMKNTTRISINVKPAVRRIVSPDSSTFKRARKFVRRRDHDTSGTGSGQTTTAARSSNQLAHLENRQQDRQHDEGHHPPHENDHHGL